MGPTVHHLGHRTPPDPIPLPVEAQLFPVLDTGQEPRHDIGLVLEIVPFGGDEKHALRQVPFVGRVDRTQQWIGLVLAWGDVRPVEDGGHAGQHVRLPVLGRLVRTLVFPGEVDDRVKGDERVDLLFDPRELRHAQGQVGAGGEAHDGDSRRVVLRFEGRVGQDGVDGRRDVVDGRGEGVDGRETVVDADDEEVVVLREVSVDVVVDLWVADHEALDIGDFSMGGIVCAAL